MSHDLFHCSSHRSQELLQLFNKRTKSLLQQDQPHRYFVMPSVEILNDSVNFEGNSDEETEKYNGDKLPSDFGADRWMKKYVRWTDERPMFSRCVVSAITASIGVLLARLTTTRTNSKVSAQGFRGHHQTEYNHIGILELIAFAVHGGLVAGPLSYKM